MRDVEHFTFFCEEVRWEENGSPIIVGVMSPLFNPEHFPVVFPRIMVLTMLRCHVSVKEVAAILNIKKKKGKRVEVVGEYHSSFDREEIDLKGEQWVAISTLPLNDVKLSKGQSLIAEIDVNGEKSITYLTAGEVLGVLEMGS